MLVFTTDTYFTRTLRKVWKFITRKRFAFIKNNCLLLHNATFVWTYKRLKSESVTGAKNDL